MNFYVYKPTLPRGNLGAVADGDLPWVYDQDPSSGFSARMLVTPAREWVGLTDEEIMAIGRELGLKCRLGGNSNIDFDYARAIEAKLREKNGITGEK